MKRYILFLFSLLSATYAIDPKAEYKLTVYFINDTSHDIDVVGINHDQTIHLAQAMRPEEEVTKVELPGTKDGIFITSVTVVDTSSDKKKSYEQNNIVVKQINWDIADSVSCKQPDEKSVFSFRFTEKIIKAFDEAEKIDNNGNITKALRNGLVEKSGLGYKLKKSQFYFRDFPKKSKNATIY